MKTSMLFVLAALLPWTLFAQSPIGAWTATELNEEGKKIRFIVIFAEDYQSLTAFEEDSGQFLFSTGGTWSLMGNSMTETVEFNSQNPEVVGKEVTFGIAITDSSLQIVGDSMLLKRIDSGEPGKLNGAWLISGRMDDGQMQERDTSGPRKTMKILSGTRFQWIAYNTETRNFIATGGGIYTTEDGKYTEKIEFFSRDNARVGASLAFDYELVDGDWHHKGTSSKGEPLYEIWSKRNYDQ